MFFDCETRVRLEVTVEMKDRRSSVRRSVCVCRETTVGEPMIGAVRCVRMG